MTILNTLLEITIYSVVLFGAIWLFRVVFKKDMSPAMLYMAWFLVIARLLLPVTITSGFSFFTVPGTEQSTVQSEGADLSGLFEGLDTNIATNSSEPMTAINDLVQSEVSQEQTDQNTATQASAVSASKVALNITWETALIFLWLAGTAVMLTVLGASAMSLKKRLKVSHAIPEGWKLIADEIKTQLGIKRNIRIVMAEGFPSPALTAGIRPTVVLPKELLQKDEEIVRFALLHEMTHIKRGDNAVSLLLLILRSVYWFNPIVWLTLRQMHVDMETACDSRLTRPMSIPDKKRYAGTMLSMYAQEQVRYVLGMAMGQTMKTAEKRLRGMFKRRRSSRRGKAVAALLAVVLLVTCFTTACQPTPEEPVVVKKNDGVMESAISASPAPTESYEAPERWTDSFQRDGSVLDINVDADITIPDVDAYPAYRINPVGWITQDTTDTILNVFFEDTPLYETLSFIREELQERLIELQKDYQDMLNGSFDYSKYDDFTDEKSHISRTEERIEELKKAISEAPENVEPVSLDTTLTTNEYGEQIIQGEADLGRDERASIWIYNSEERAYVRFVNEGGYTGNTSESSSKPLAGLTISQEEAQSRADELLLELGMGNYAMSGISIQQRWVGSEDKLQEGNPYAYVLIYTRMINGIQAAAEAHIYIDDDGGKDVDDEYAPVYGQELVTVTVDDDGIREFVWENNYEIIETASENVELMPLDEIKDVIEQQMFVQNADIAQYDVTDEDKVDYFVTEEFCYSIQEISLEYVAVSVKDKLNEQWLIPVWNVYASYKSRHRVKVDGEIVDQEFQSGSSDLVLTINAIDGSAIS